METLKNIKTEFLELLEKGDQKNISEYLNSLHPADIADLFKEIEPELYPTLKYYLKDEIFADVLVELDKSVTQDLIEHLSPKEVALSILPHMDSDDAVDLISLLSEEKRISILSELNDINLSQKILKLLNYAPNTAGSLMATELLKVNFNLSISEALFYMRSQAKHISQIHAIYVVDNNQKLLGTLSLIKLLSVDSHIHIKELYDDKVHSVTVNETIEQVNLTMTKYDLVSIPVVTDDNILLGRITFDDVMKYINENSNKRFGFFSGISKEVNFNDTTFSLIQARLPWLFIGLLGEILAANVIKGFKGTIAETPEIVFFIPLIAAMGGNTGIQSSSMIVQELSKKSNDFKLKFKIIFKELRVSLLNGIFCSLLVLFLSFYLTKINIFLAIAMSSSLICVIIIAGIFGIIIPSVLHRLKVNSAIATGPFITTLNDGISMIIYFKIIHFIYSFQL